MMELVKGKKSSVQFSTLALRIELGWPFLGKVLSLAVLN